MQQHACRESKVDGLFGIRTTIWLVAFGVMLGCVAIICRHHSKPSVHEVAAEQVRDRDSAGIHWPMIRKTAHAQVTLLPSDDPVSFDNGELDLTSVEQGIQDRRTWTDGVW
jgi:hypothetical protein